jgi:hypothetical protein
VLAASFSLTACGAGSDVEEGASARTATAPTVNTLIDEEGEAVFYTAAHQAWNNSTYQGLLAPYAQIGAHRCVVHRSADFPQLAVITVVRSSGHWVQVSVDVRSWQVDPTSVRTGADYTSALGGATFDEFAANGLECAVTENGRLGPR